MKITVYKVSMKLLAFLNKSNKQLKSEIFKNIAQIALKYEMFM